jgi:hypothetical protein
MEFVRTKKDKPKEQREHKHHFDSRDQRIEDLERQLAEVKGQKEQLIIKYQSLRELKEEAVEDAHAWKQHFEDRQDKYEELHTRFKRQGEEIKHKDKIIRQRDSEIRQRDKELEELRVDKKVKNGTIKKLEDQDVALRDKVTILTNEKRMLLLEVSVRKSNEEKQLAENKKLKDENTRVRDRAERERQLAIDRETRLRREREELERREAERRAPPRRPFDYDEFLDDARFARSRPMPRRPRNGIVWEGRWPDSD